VAGEAGVGESLLGVVVDELPDCDEVPRDDVREVPGQAAQVAARLLVEQVRGDVVRERRRRRAGRRVLVAQDRL
jgi:hypothetical protein